MKFCLIQMQQGYWRLNLVFLLAIIISFQEFFQRDLRLSQWFCWRSKCGIQHWVAGWVVPNVSKDHSAFFLGFVDLDATGTMLLHVSNYLPEKSQKTLIIINTTMRTLNLACNILFRWNFFTRYSVVTLTISNWYLSSYGIFHKYLNNYNYSTLYSYEGWSSGTLSGHGL